MSIFKRFFLKKRIYLDYASATPVDSGVLKAMQPYFSEEYANPNALHRDGVRAHIAIEQARKSIATILSGHTDEIIFTGSGTESDALAVLGVIEAWYENNSGTIVVPHIITTEIEHPAILELVKSLAFKKRIEVTFIGVTSLGIVDPVEIKKALRPETILVSVMYANNEIGTIQPIIEIAKIIRHFKKHAQTEKNIENIYPLFHTDAAQAVQYLPVNVLKLHVDLLSCNGSKIYGPKGSGLLYRRRGIPFQAPFPGGGQEFGLRSGTENVSHIVGLAKALELTETIKDRESHRVTLLRDYFFDQLQNSKIIKNSGISINGDLENRLPNNINISVPGIPSELLVLEFDVHGISVSAKSACQSDDPDESYVLKALNPNLSLEFGSIRFSLGRDTKKGDIDMTIQSFEHILNKLKKWYTLGHGSR
jgi:cysteine desulfurase